MKIKEAKVGHAIRGESSNTLTDTNFDMEFKDHVLHVRRKTVTARPDYYVVFPSNLAYVVPFSEEELEAKKPKKVK